MDLLEIILFCFKVNALYTTIRELRELYIKYTEKMDAEELMFFNLVLYGFAIGFGIVLYYSFDTIKNMF